MITTKTPRIYPPWLRGRIARPARGYAKLKKAQHKSSGRQPVLPGEAQVSGPSKSKYSHDLRDGVFANPPSKTGSKAARESAPSFLETTPFIIPEVEPIAERPRGTLFYTGWLVSGTVFALMLGWYGSTIYHSVTSPLPEEESNQEIDLTDVYNVTAKSFDADVDSYEYWSGMMKLRSRMVKQARGDVLESAAGTGRNSEYYVKEKINSLTLVDKSSGMLALAEKKWPNERKDEDWSGRIQFVVADVEDEIDTSRLKPQSGGGKTDAQYDTVVQTMGLCSTDHPEVLISSLARLVKPGGKILLLEHGRGFLDWLNVMLDKSARRHAARHGCWWNRDIGAIVAKSGLETVEMSRPWLQLGTTWYIVLRKPSEVDASKKNSV